MNGSEVVQSVHVNGKREGKWRLMPRCERTGIKTFRGCERKEEGKSQSVNVNGKGITRNGCERNGNCQIHGCEGKEKRPFKDVNGKKMTLYRFVNEKETS